MEKIACTRMCHRMHFLDLQHLYVFWTAGLLTEVCLMSQSRDNVAIMHELLTVSSYTLSNSISH